MIPGISLIIPTGQIVPVLGSARIFPPAVDIIALRVQILCRRLVHDNLCLIDLKSRRLGRQTNKEKEQHKVKDYKEGSQKSHQRTACSLSRIEDGDGNRNDHRPADIGEFIPPPVDGIVNDETCDDNHSPVDQDLRNRWSSCLCLVIDRVIDRPRSICPFSFHLVD